MEVADRARKGMVHGQRLDLHGRTVCRERDRSTQRVEVIGEVSEWTNVRRMASRSVYMRCWRRGGLVRPEC